MISVTIPDKIDPESKKQMILLLEKAEKAIEEATRHFAQVPFRPNDFNSRYDFDRAFSHGHFQYSKLVEVFEYLHVSIELLNGRNPHE